MNVYSPVNQLLRNRLRVLNHLPLIREKLKRGQRWGLVFSPTEGQGPHEEVQGWLRELQTNRVSSTRVSQEIARLFKSSPGEVNQDLDYCYQTGLLEFHPTDQCDLECRDCHYRTKGDETIPFEAINSLMTALRPVAITITGGGEPTIYHSQGKKFSDLVERITHSTGSVPLGLINNNTFFPRGEWHTHFLWQRSSMDSGTPATYKKLKNRDLYFRVRENIRTYCQTTRIPHVGVGFLVQEGNMDEIETFILDWWQWVQSEKNLDPQRINLQFRTLAPPIHEVQSIRESQDAKWLGAGLRDTFLKEVNNIQQRRQKDTSFDSFVSVYSNFDGLTRAALSGNGPFMHRDTSFDSCYNALIHRVFRATGEEYPDFLLCDMPQYCMGNSLKGDPVEQRRRVTLMQFFYFNKMSPHCHGSSCRQSWVNRTVSEGIAGNIPHGEEIPDMAFF